MQSFQPDETEGRKLYHRQAERLAEAQLAIARRKVSMPSFSTRSFDNLATCHPDLQKVATECIKHFDFTVIEGHRGKEAQDKAYATGKSKVKFPNSKHNKKPSLAFDAVPHPLDWEDIDSFHAMAKAMKAAASTVKVKIKWGGDFKGFFDGPHFELA